jgi:hypothetical protein
VENKKVWRDVAITLVLATVFGVVLVYYITKDMPNIAELGPRLVPGAGTGASTGYEEAQKILSRAEAVADPFVEHLAAGRLDDAYGMMARPYRDTTSLARFKRVWTTSPLLAGVKSVRLVGTRSGSVMTAAGVQRPVATTTARGQLVVRAGVLDVSFTFIAEEDQTRILAMFIVGVPVLQGVTAAGVP